MVCQPSSEYAIEALSEAELVDKFKNILNTQGELNLFIFKCSQARMGGLIGELPVGRNYQQTGYGNQYNPQLLGYGGEPQQMVAKLRIGAEDPSRHSSQLAFYRGQQPSYGNGAPLGQVNVHQA